MQAFQTLKDTLASPKVLAHYNPALEVKLAVDASPFGLGVVISHISQEVVERPIAYATRTLTSAERNYSVIDKEALAIIFGIRKFNSSCMGIDSHLWPITNPSHFNSVQKKESQPLQLQDY